MKILAVGDVVGRRSIEYLSKTLRKITSSLGADLVAVNGENASEIHGLCKADAEALLDAGADLITLGNHAFGSRDLYGFLDDHTDEIIRPANYPAACPGVGYALRQVSGLRVLCMNLSGTAFMDQLDNPFAAVDRILEREKGDYDVAILDFHAEATSEKQALGRYADGRVALVVGTHTHVQTNDATLLPKGTGYLTDLGMCGAQHSILGKGLEPCVHNFVDPENRMKITDGPAPYMINGLVAEIDEKTKTCRGLELINITEIN